VRLAGQGGGALALPPAALEVLSAFAVVAPIDNVASALTQRCSGVIDRVLPGFAAPPAFVF